jgi:hypothetical protein
MLPPPPSLLRTRFLLPEFEGVWRQANVHKGRNRDTAWFSILDSEWPAIKTAFERWLSPKNFDAEGRQRIRLSVLNAGARRS